MVPGGQDIHATVPLPAVMSQEWEQRPDPEGVKPEGGGRYSKFPRSSQALEGSRHRLQQRSVQISINLASTLRCLISVVTAIETCDEGREPKT